MKTGGFNIEDTGLTHPNIITTLYRIICILTALSYRAGMLTDEVIPIKSKLYLPFKPVLYRLKSALNLPSFSVV